MGSGMYIRFFLVFLVPSVIASDCHPCHCYRKGHYTVANCSDLNLKKIPPSIPKTVWHLIMKNNTLNKIANKTFEKFSHLRYLDISYCNINVIEMNGFGGLWKIDTLDMSFNSRIGFQTLGSAMFGLRNTKLRVLKANKIVTSFAVCVCITKAMLRYFNETRIEEIQVDHNRIEIFEPGSLMLLPPTLKNVSAANNRFTAGPYLRDVYRLTNLTELDISNSNDVQVLSTIVPAMDYVSINEHCDNEEYDHPSTMYRRRFQSPLPFKLPPNLKILRSNYVDLVFSIHEVNFGVNKLEEAYFNFNVFKSFYGPIIGLNHIQTLEVSDNFCNYISHSFFVNMTSLKKLDLSYNILNLVLYNDTSGAIFNPLRALTHLNLAKNNIVFLPNKIFQGLESCVFLNLSHNMIESEYMKVNLTRMNNLNFIDFSSNRIKWIGRTMRSELDHAAKRSGHLTIDLTDNRLACTCLNYECLNWIVRQKHVKFLNHKNYECVYSNGTIVYLNSSDFIFEQMEKNCNSHEGQIITSVSSVLVIIGFIVGATIYRFRWKLRYLYYAYGKSKQLTDVEYEYDAFISYSEDSRLFVDHTMRTKVEEEYGLKLCLHNRNFVPSLPIAQGIVTAIKSSRKTVLVLSPDFIDSYWCCYEMNMADIEGQHTDRDVVLVLFYKHIDYHKIPTTVMYQIKTHTYIEYPYANEDSDAMEKFWDNFTKAITCP